MAFFITPQEDTMEKIETHEDEIDLGTASVETKGNTGQLRDGPQPQDFHIVGLYND